MAIQQRTVNYAKELDDVAKLPADMIRAIRAAKAAGLSTAQIVMQVSAAEFTEFVDAVSGFTDISSEFQVDPGTCYRTLGYQAGDTAAALLGQ
jgi:hypothetical protein